MPPPGPCRARTPRRRSRRCTWSASSRPSWSCRRSVSRRRCARSSRRTCSRSSGRVHAERVVLRFHGLDPDAVLERAQLLERLRRVRAASARAPPAPAARCGDTRRGRYVGRAAASRRADRATCGNRRAREIQREAAAIDDDLDDVRVVQLGRVVDAPVQRRHLDRRIGDERRDQLRRSRAGSISGSSPCTLTTMSQSSVAATSASRSVPVSWSPCVSRTLPPKSVTRVAMRRSSVATMTCDDDRRRRGAPVHVLDHRPAVDVGERLCREAG